MTTNTPKTRYTPDRFNQGSGTYRCECCGKMTRETGDGESDHRLCARCNFEGLMENSIQDGDQKCTCGNQEDFEFDFDHRRLICNKCGAVGLYENWTAPKGKLTNEEKKARKQERRRARRAAKKAAAEEAGEAPPN